MLRYVFHVTVRLHSCNTLADAHLTMLCTYQRVYATCKQARRPGGLVTADQLYREAVKVTKHQQ
jgi:hypothetical protein